MSQVGAFCEDRMIKHDDNICDLTVPEVEYALKARENDGNTPVSCTTDPVLLKDSARSPASIFRCNCGGALSFSLF